MRVLTECEIRPSGLHARRGHGGGRSAVQPRLAQAAPLHAGFGSSSEVTSEVRRLDG
jgi:hypothetical protein